MSQDRPEDGPVTDPQERPDGDEVDVDERSKQSFPTSDPPSTWAGEDLPDQA